MIDLAAVVYCSFCGADITRAKGHYWVCPVITDEILQRALKPSPLFQQIHKKTTDEPVIFPLRKTRHAPF